MKESSLLIIITVIISNTLCGFDYFELEGDCSDFSNYKHEYCEVLDAGNENKKCTYINNKCISTFKNCEDYYNQKVCESIIPDGFPEIKCVLERNSCIPKERICSDFKFGLESNSNCMRLKSSDEKKRCVFANNKCEEQFKECEDFKENVNKELCESIRPLYDYNEMNYKCIFEGGKCVKKERHCEDYDYSLGFIVDELCESLTPTDISKRCALVNDTCIEQFIKCEDYNGNDTKICESIVPGEFDNEYLYFYPEYNNKCVFEEGKCKKKALASCSDYIPGKREEYCNSIELQDSKKICLFSNNKCIETFKSCEEYEGDDIKQDICESIIPTREKDDFNFRDYIHKCVYENKKCVTKNILCSELNNIVGFKLEQ